jgi:hypothetical protein
VRRRIARRALAASGLGGVLALLASARAWAGTDVFSNIAPASPLGSAAAFARYPFSHYELDRHFTVISASITGGVNVDGLLPAIAWFFASLIWLVTAFLAKVVIELFAFAFSLDLVNGSAATGGAGALGPVSQAIHSIYANVFGAPWLVLAFSAVALWAMWRALVQRRYVETAGALALSLIYIVVAIFFVAEPGQTIGQASRWTNEMSQAFLSISAHGNPSGGEAATADDSDQLWGLLVERPWSVLEFGGLEHCAIDGTGDEDSDPQSAPVRPLSKDAGRSAALSKQLAEGTEVAAEGKTCINNANKYASHFLRFGNSTEERDAEYEALNHGNTEELPEADSEKGGYTLGVADKPATDAMEEGGQYQRLLLAPIIAVGETGAFLLLGSLAIGVILSQVLLLLLLAFSPVALVAAAIPGRGHDFFKAWLEKLAGYLLRKAAYSLVLAVLLAVNSAIADATSQIGWLFAFGLQAAFFWTVFLQRRTLTGGIIGIATGAKAPGHDLALDAVALYAGARLGASSLRGAGRVGGAALSRVGRRKGEGSSRRPSFGGTSETRPVDWSGSGGDAGPNDPGPGDPDSSGPHGSGDSGPGGPGSSGPGGPGPDREDKGPDKRRGGKKTPVEEEDGPERSGGKGHQDDEPAKEGSAGGEESRDRRGSRRPGAPKRPDVEEPDRQLEHGAGDEPKPAPRRRSTEGGATGEAGDTVRPERRPKPTDRQRPEVRKEGDRSKPSADREARGGSSGTTPKRSGLSDELRSERERAKRPAKPAATPDRGPTPEPDAAGSRDRRPTAQEPAAPSSPPRRRRRRLWRRRR